MLRGTVQEVVGTSVMWARHRGHLKWCQCKLCPSHLRQPGRHPSRPHPSIPWKTSDEVVASPPWRSCVLEWPGFSHDLLLRHILILQQQYQLQWRGPTVQHLQTCFPMTARNVMLVWKAPILRMTLLNYACCSQTIPCALAYIAKSMTMIILSNPSFLPISIDFFRQVYTVNSSVGGACITGQ